MIKARDAIRFFHIVIILSACWRCAYSNEWDSIPLRNRKRFHFEGVHIKRSQIWKHQTCKYQSRKSMLFSNKTDTFPHLLIFTDPTSGLHNTKRNRKAFIHHSKENSKDILRLELFWLNSLLWSTAQAHNSSKMYFIKLQQN